MKIPLPFLLGVLLFAGCSDIPDVQPSANLTVYPNPAISVASVQVVNQHNAAFLLQVFDTRGNLILEKNGSQQQQTFQVELNGKPKGKYQVILKTKAAVSTCDLIKL